MVEIREMQRTIKRKTSVVGTTRVPTNEILDFS